MTFTIIPIPLAPTPCHALPMINECIFGARAQSRLVKKNIACDKSMMGLRLNVLETAPEVGVLAVWARMKEEPIQM